MRKSTRLQEKQQKLLNHQSNLNFQFQATQSERITTSFNKENIYPLQAHYQQYLLQQQQQQNQVQNQQQQIYLQSQSHQKNSISSQNFQSSDLSLSQSSQGQMIECATFEGEQMSPQDRHQFINQDDFQPQNSQGSYQSDNQREHTSRSYACSGSFLETGGSKETPNFKKRQTTTQNSNKNSTMPLQQIQNKPQNSRNIKQTNRRQNSIMNGTPILAGDYQKQFDKKIAVKGHNHHHQKQSSITSSILSGSSKQLYSKNTSNIMSAALPSNQSSNCNSSVKKQFKSTHKHLRFDSVHSSSNHQIMSITSQQYQAFISGSSENNNQSSEKKEQVVCGISLNNSLLECVDQYGNHINEYTPNGEDDNIDYEEEQNYEEEENDQLHEQVVSDLNDNFSPNNPSLVMVNQNPQNPYYFPSDQLAKSKAGSIDEIYHIKLANLINNHQNLHNNSHHIPNFVVCSPSAYTEDDCQYTNSSALKSILSSTVRTGSSKEQMGKKKQYIRTDEKREEDLSSQAIDEQTPQRSALDNCQQYQEQFTGDEEDESRVSQDQQDGEEEIESKLNMITGSSQFNTRDDRRKSTKTVPSNYDLPLQRPSNGGRQDYPNTTPEQQQLPSYIISGSGSGSGKAVEVLDSDLRRQRIVHDTPQVMEMIDSTTSHKKSVITGRPSNINEQQSPEMLGSRHNRRRQKNQQQQQEANTRNSSRYLNFKDTSPMVKSCNTFVFENQQFLNTLPNQSAVLDLGYGGNTLQNLIGKISPPFLQNHYPSLVSKPNEKLFPLQTVSTLGNANPLQTSSTIGCGQGKELFITVGGNNVETVDCRAMLLRNGDRHMNDLVSPGAESKISSMIESPPPVTDPTPDKGIKDFSRRYLGTGMWPKHQFSQQHNEEYYSSNNYQSQQLNKNQLDKSYGESNLKYSMTLSSKMQDLNSSTVNSKSAKYYQNAQVNHQNKPVTAISHHTLISHDKTATTLDNTYYNNNSKQIPLLLYPNLDASIVHKINKTIVNSSSNQKCKTNENSHSKSQNVQFYFKRPSEHVGIGNSSIANLRSSRGLESQNNISGILNNFSHPNQVSMFNVVSQINPNNNTTIYNQGSAANQSSFDDLCIINENTTGIQQNTNDHKNHPRTSNLSNGCCKECLFEKEKRNVTQKAFERALGISLFLMEQIDNLNLKSSPNSHLLSTFAGTGTAETQNNFQISRQEIMNLLKTTGSGTNQTTTCFETFQCRNSYESQKPIPTFSNQNGIIQSSISGSQHKISLNPHSQNPQGSQTSRVLRSRSQNVMPPEVAQLQKSLQIPRGFGGIGASLANQGFLTNRNNITQM